MRVPADGETPNAPRSVVLIAGGTGVLGASGLLVLVATAAVLGPADYAVFAVFWSALFFAVAVLAGAQQEVTRAVAVQQDSPEPGTTSVLTFAAIMATLAGGVMAVTSPWWAPVALGSGHAGLALVAALGAAGFTLLSVLAGLAAGSREWGIYSSSLAVEGAFRAVAVGAALVATANVSALAWAVVIAYPVTILVVFWPRAGRLRRHVRVATRLRYLMGNSGKTIVATASLAGLVTGFPLLMSVLSRGAPASTVGALTLAVMLTRAPLLFPLTALQSFLIARFVVPDRASIRTIVRLVLISLGAAALLALLAGAVGPRLFHAVFGAEFTLDGHILALLVLSSGLLASLTVTSAALISWNLHTSNAFSWFAALTVLVLVLAVPSWGLEQRATLSLLIGPAVGLGSHAAVLCRVFMRSRRHPYPAQ